MDIPDIPDNRPDRGGSSLSYSPTIVLDEIVDTKSEYINQQLGTPPNEPREQFDPEEHKPRDPLDQQW